jgi:hypothetical protein
MCLVANCIFLAQDRVQKFGLTLEPILDKSNPVYPHSIKIHFNIMLPSTLRSTKGIFALRSLHENIIPNF